jgi:hypothetical protein
VAFDSRFWLRDPGISVLKCSRLRPSAFDSCPQLAATDLHVASHSLCFSLSAASIRVHRTSIPSRHIMCDEPLGFVATTADVSVHFSFSAATNPHIGWNFHPCVLVVFIYRLHTSPHCLTIPLVAAICVQVTLAACKDVAATKSTSVVSP